jgi:hypothetical protein
MAQSINLESIVEWQAPEHHFDKRTADWYWILGIIALAGAVLSFYFGNFLFAIFILLGGFTIGFLSYRETKDVTVKVTNKGIVFHKFLYEFRSHKSFWIEDDHTRGPRLLMHPLGTLSTLTVIPISEEIDLEQLRDLLLNFLDEEMLQESLVHRLFDKIGL